MLSDQGQVLSDQEEVMLGRQGAMQTTGQCVTAHWMAGPGWRVAAPRVATPAHQPPAPDQAICSMNGCAMWYIFVVMHLWQEFPGQASAVWCTTGWLSAGACITPKSGHAGAAVLRCPHAPAPATCPGAPP